jgi:D-alanyl-D-alanine carboxypeptidase
MTHLCENTASTIRPRRILQLAAVLACLTAAGVAAASALVRPTAESKAPSLQQDVDALVEGGAPGAILLVRDGNRTIRYTGGFADVARKRPMQARDHFKIASLTKTYTATVVLQLVAERKLSLNDTVQQRLPGLVPNGSKITIRQLLKHTSGLSDFETDARYLKPYLAGNFAHYWSPRQLVRMGARTSRCSLPVAAGRTRTRTTSLLS